MEPQKHYIVRGGGKLSGNIVVAGAKNAITKQLVASLLTDEPCLFTNVPRIEEVNKVLAMLSEVGSQYEWMDENTLKIATPKILNNKVGQQFQRYNRIPILLLGPLLHRSGSAVIPIPGGCQIGSRPVDFHINALKKMGVKIDSTNFDYEATADDRLKGTAITLPFPSVGATENILFAAVLAQGITIIDNSAIEPEVMDTIELLRKMGARITSRKNRRLIIYGVESLKGAEHHTVSDRIEAASFAVLALATNGRIAVDIPAKIVEAFLEKYRCAGGGYVLGAGDEITFFRETQKIKPVHIETDVFPGFATDWQQPFVVALTQADGVSVVHETVYEKRFGYTETLNKMSAKINLSEFCLGSIPCRFKNNGHLHSCIISGPTPLFANKIEMPDLRAGFAYMVAALIASGTSHIYGVEQLERGYANAVEKLRSVGASIEVIG